MKMTFLTLEELMPEKHFLRDLERSVDFSFIYDIVEPLYARVGRPSIDPVLLVKMLLLGYLYDLFSIPLKPIRLSGINLYISGILSCILGNILVYSIL